MIITHLFSTGEFDTHQSNTHLSLKNVKFIGTPSESKGREKWGSNPSALTLCQDSIR